jgi:hypothetical protein
MAMFLAGLVFMNTVMTASARGLPHRSTPFSNRASLRSLDRSHSFIIGCVYLLHSSNRLPPFG